jgi:D-glycero-D-manno-heptose 1,7-bisphosphate phosphatase
MNPERKNRAVFLDRDGIVNKDGRYLYRPEDIVFKDDIFPFCHAVQQKGYLLVIVTNQSGVARGYYTENDVGALHRWMNTKFEEQNIQIAGFYYCPFLKDAVVEKYALDSPLRKPKPGMILQASDELDVDISGSVMIGDKESDRIECNGLRSIIVRSEYVPDNYDVEGLLDILHLLE